MFYVFRMYKMMIRTLSFESRLAALSGGSIDLQIKNQIGTILINQPTARNAISGSMMLDFQNVLQEVESNKNLKCILFRGNGDKAFCAGSDLRYIPGFYHTLHDFTWINQFRINSKTSLTQLIQMSGRLQRTRRRSRILSLYARYYSSIRPFAYPSNNIY